jgi:hypothetical protein
MYAAAKTKKENKSRAAAYSAAQRKSAKKQRHGFVDNRMKPIEAKSTSKRAETTTDRHAKEVDNVLPTELSPKSDKTTTKGENPQGTKTPIQLLSMQAAIGAIRQHRREFTNWYLNTYIPAMTQMAASRGTTVEALIGPMDVEQFLADFDSYRSTHP